MFPRALVAICDLLIEVFPQELYDIIIDILQENETTLSACSLVRSSWTNQAHRHLFRSLSHSRGSQPPNVLGLVNFLDNSPHICQYIRTLCLHGGEYHSSAGINPTIWEALLTSLPFLEELSLKSLSIFPHISALPLGNELQDSIWRPRPNRKSLNKLSFEQVCIRRPPVHFPTLCILFLSVLTINRLVVDGVYYEDGGGPLNGFDMPPRGHPTFVLPRGLNLHTVEMRNHQIPILHDTHCAHFASAESDHV